MWIDGDFNYDGVTNTADFTALAMNFNQPPLGAAALGALVPEPTMLVAATLAWLIARRRARALQV